MTLETSRMKAPYPERPDTADVPRDVEALAEALDSVIPFYSGPYLSRPATGASLTTYPGFPGRIWYATDLTVDDPNKLTLDSAAGWVSIAFTMVIADRSINHIKLMLNTITIDEMGASSVGATQLVNAAVNQAKIANAAVLPAHIGAALKPSSGASDTAETLRALFAGVGSATGKSAKAVHAASHLPGSWDPLDLTYFKPTYSTALPATPIDGQETYLLVDATTGVVWYLRYKLSTNNWEFLGGSPKYTTNFGTGITIPYSGDYIVIGDARADGFVDVHSPVDSYTNLTISKNGAALFSGIASINGSGWNTTMHAEQIVTLVAADVITADVTLTFSGSTLAVTNKLIQVKPVKVHV